MKNKNIFLFGLLLGPLFFFSGNVNAADFGGTTSSGYSYEECKKDGEGDAYCKQFDISGNEDYWGGNAGSAADCGDGFTVVAGVCMPGQELTGGLSQEPVLVILANLLSWLFALFSILAIMAFVISGIQYLVSAGDTGIIEVAKRNMTWSIVGIAVGLSGFMILKAVSAALAGSPIF